jgi:hypothetical protein
MVEQFDAKAAEIRERIAGRGLADIASTWGAFGSRRARPASGRVPAPGDFQTRWRPTPADQSQLFLVRHDRMQVDAAECRFILIRSYSGLRQPLVAVNSGRKIRWMQDGPFSIAGRYT